MMATVPSPDLEMKLFVMGSSLELSVLSAKGEFGKAVKSIPPPWEVGLEQFGHFRASTVRRAELALQAAYVSLGAGEYDRALRWCNRLLNEKGIEAHTELHALGRMLNLMVLVELGKEELLGLHSAQHPTRIEAAQRPVHFGAYPAGTGAGIGQARLHETPERPLAKPIAGKSCRPQRRSRANAP